MSPFAICVLISNVFGLVTYSLDVYSDLALGIHWFKMGHSNWGAATLAFFFIPGAINSVLGAIFAWKFFIGCFRVLALVLCCLFAAPVVSSLERIIRRCGKHQLRWDIWFTPTGEMCEGASAGPIGGIGSRQRAIEVTLEAVPQIGLQLYIAAKKNALGGLQLFSLLTSTVGGVFTVVYALDDLVATPLRRHLFDCSNVFRPALAIGAGFWSFLALSAHLPAVAFFGAAAHGAALTLGAILYFQGFLAFLPLHLGKKQRSWANRICVCIPSLLGHCLMTGVVVCLAQMWFIKAMVLSPSPLSTIAPAMTSQAPPSLSGSAVDPPAVSAPDSSLPNFIWPEPVWPLSEWKRMQEKRKSEVENEKVSFSFAVNGSSIAASSSSSSKLSWSLCKLVNGTDSDRDLDDDGDDRDDEHDEESWWSSRLRVSCLTDRAEQVVLSLMWINAAFFFLQSFLIVFLNVVDTRAIMVE